MKNLVELCIPYLKKTYDLNTLNNEKIEKLILLVSKEMMILSDSVELLKFYFQRPILDFEFIKNIVNQDSQMQLKIIIKDLIEENDFENFVNNFKKECSNSNIQLKVAFSYLRFILIGSCNGLSIADLIEVLEIDEVKKRLQS